MTKTNKKIIIGISIIILAIAVTFSFLFIEMSAFTTIDYRFYDDFLISSPAITQCSIKTTNLANDECVASDSNWYVNMGRSGGTDGVTRIVATSKYQNGDLILSAMDNGFYTITTAKSLKENDFRLTFEVFKNCNPDINIRFNGEGGTQIFNNLDLPPGETAGRCIESTTSHIIEGIHSILNDTMFIFVNGQERASVPITNGKLFIQIGASYQPRIELKLKSLMIRNFLNCDVEADEIAIKDVFTEGSTFNIDDLTYEPVKLCPTEYPFVLRDLSGGIRADVKAEMVNILNKGESITVPQGKVIEAHYIADFKQGMGEPCQLGFAKNSKTLICEQVIFEAPDIVEVVRDTRLIQTGSEEIPFINSTVIGDKSISSTPIKYLCTGETKESVVNAPDPRSECWETTISTPFGQSFDIKDGEEKSINGYFNIKFFADARYDGSDAVIKKNNRNLILVVKNRDFLDITSVKDSEFFILLNADKEFKFNIENKLPINFAQEQAGFTKLITKDLITTQTSGLKNNELKQGINPFSEKLDTLEIGGIIYQITPFITINDKKIFDDKEFITNYYIKTEEQLEKAQPETQTITAIEYQEKIIEKEKIINKIPIWVWVVFILLIIFIILIIFIKKKRRR